MNYTIRDDIKMIAANPNFSGEQGELLKKTIVKYVKDYLDLKKGKNSLANITDIVRDVFKVEGTNYPFERDIAGRMMRTRNYTMREKVNKGGKDEVFVIAADRDWWDKYKIWFSLALAIAAALFGAITDPLKSLLNRPSNDQRPIKEIIQINLQGSKSILLQSDSVYTLEIVKADSAHKSTK